MQTSSLLALLLAACGPKRAPSPLVEAPTPDYRGETHVELDLIRAYPGADKIYVEVDLPDGSTGLFLVDTGAGISAIDQDLADRLELNVQDSGGTIQGLGGAAAWRAATVPWISLDGLIVDGVDVAVGIPGMPEYTGFIEVDGILGNNVWGDYVLAVDYPADRLEVGRPGTIDVPDTAARMSFDGSHVHTGVVLEAQGPEGPLRHDILLEIDTGARQVLLSGVTGHGLEEASTEGEEPIFGLGASDKMPVSAFYRRTRHVPLDAVELGGQRVEAPGFATWINYDDGARIGPSDLLGLAGHVLLAEHRVVFDYPGGRFALTESTGEARETDGHQLMLDKELERHGEAAARGMLRARYKVALADLPGALVDLEAYMDSAPEDFEAQVLAARIHRYQGDLDGYAERVGALEPAQLVEQGEIVATVNGLLLTGQAQRALELAQKAVEASPQDSGALVALADAQLGNGQADAARRSLSEAGRVDENPDAYLKRRARIALVQGDRYAALSHLRRRLTLYPSDGEALWFYAMLVAELDEDSSRATFRRDADQAMARLHAEARPLDFLMASLAMAGEDTGELRSEGEQRDCAAIEDEASRNNCMAWYAAMAGSSDDEALDLIQAAVKAEANRADFLDTLAMVHLVRGELDEAAQASLEAAQLSPDRFYHLWQAERIRTLAESQGD